MRKLTTRHAPGLRAAARRWPLVVVGGGPAAAIEIAGSGIDPRNVLVIAARLGTGMRFLGHHLLQSYVQELALGVEDPSLPEVMSELRVQPSAEEYERYVETSVERSAGALLLGVVGEMRRIEGGLALVVRPLDGGRPFEVTADRVALATGNRPRRPWPEWRRHASTYDEVYASVLRGDVTRYAGRSVVIVGSGNSALQTAALLANHASDVTILGNHYPGLYPLETSDRFAWRSASHLTYELAVKGGEQCGRSGAIPCVRFVVYRSLVREPDGTAVFDYAAADNRHRIGTASLPPRCMHTAEALPWPAGGGWTERRGPDTEVVWATGSDPQYPEAALLAALPRDDRGFIVHDGNGATPVPGLYVVGSCAGARSVNEMRPVVFAEMVRQAESLSLDPALEPRYA